MINPIYKPKGKAAEYGDYAVNIYTGCPHRCYYCYAPSVLRKDRETFHSSVEPRDGIVEAVEKQLAKGKIKGKTIHLCFTCDPYPTGFDTTPTRDIIRLIKESGNNVQILTKGNENRDFDLFDENDWYGITYDGYEMVNDNYFACCNIETLKVAHMREIKTWISFEPVLDDKRVLYAIENLSFYVDKIKIGKLNYFPSDINWKDFGRKAEELCKSLGIEYYIKGSLRKEMIKNGQR